MSRLIHKAMSYGVKGEHDAVVLKQDRGETYVLTRLSHYSELLQ